MTQGRIDYAFGLIIQSGEFDVSVRVSTAFSVNGGQGAGTYDPENTPSLAPLLTFHKVAVEGGEVRKDGRLTLTFRDGRVLTVEPHDSYEAFDVSGTAPAMEPRFHLVAIPGGGLAAF